VRLDVWQDLDGALVTTRADGGAMTTRFADRTTSQLDPRVGAIVRATDRGAVRASVYRAFRAPTLNELYRPFQVGTVLTDANPALRPETSWGAELGPELVMDTWIARATGFWNELDQPIDNVTLATPLADGATRQRQNLGHARVNGVELEASWRPTQRWIANAAYTLVRPTVTAAPGLPDLVGKDLAQDPRHRASASLTFDDERIVTATAQVRLIGRAYEDDLNTLPMDRYVVVDALIERRVVGRLDAFADAQNLFDARYLVGRAGVDTLGPPRVVLVGLRLTSAR
jgi:outer membrane receptor protein involved in Fe transport